MSCTFLTPLLSATFGTLMSLGHDGSDINNPRTQTMVVECRASCQSSIVAAIVPCGACVMREAVLFTQFEVNVSVSWTQVLSRAVQYDGETYRQASKAISVPRSIDPFAADLSTQLC